MESAQIAVVFGLAAVQIVGLLCVLSFRASLATSCSYGVFGRFTFFFFLGLVGISAVVCLLLGSAGWVFSATTLCLMILGSVCDFSRWQASTG